MGLLTDACRRMCSVGNCAEVDDLLYDEACDVWVCSARRHDDTVDVGLA